jgi:hypothetical protein
MQGRVWRIGSMAMAISLWAQQADAVGPNRFVRFAQNGPDAPPGAAGQIQSGAPETVPANAPEQIKKAQTELKRLDCLKGRIDGKLGTSTRDALKKYWTMAREDVVELRITDELIAELAEHGDNYCRPKRPFFGFGGRPTMLFFAPGARGPVPQPPVPPPPALQPPVPPQQ